MVANGASNRSSRVRDDLRARIASGEWEIHSRIPGETALAAEYGVSRGTVREALRSLTGLGLLEAAAGRGTFVRSRVPTDAVLVALMSERGPAECLQLRAAIEGEAARTLAARRDAAAAERLAGAARGDGSRERMPGEFHSRLVEEGCEPLAVSVHAALMHSVRGFLMSGRLRHALDDAARDRDHEAVVAAIRAGDAADAARLAAEHAYTDLVVG